MSSRLFRLYAFFSVLVIAVTSVASVRGMRRNRRARATAQASTTHRAPASAAPPQLISWPANVAWIAAGGGPTPEFNQISLEEDLALAAQTFGRVPGVVLFAGGPGSQSVQVSNANENDDDLEGVLGDFFDARQGRDAHYEAVSIPTLAAATKNATLDAFRRALTESDANASLLFYLAGHGEMGEKPVDAGLPMWGGDSLHPSDLATVFDRAEANRTVRVVITSCFSGGFAEIAYTNADAARGGTELDRCGFFATTWDEQASGCDPDPDRGHHEGYGVHFLHALRGEDRSGHALPSTEIDFDGDGSISYLEAHSFALLASASLDVPTTTSQAFLRHVARPNGPATPIAMPENDAIIATLSARLGIAGREESARDELATREAMLVRLRHDAEGFAELENGAYQRAAAALLSRYPVLDDPWHPDFGPTLQQHGAEIASFFESSREINAWQHAQESSGEIGDRIDVLLVDVAPYRRLVRALDDRMLAAQLRHVGGPAWNRYQRFLACERGTPP